MDEEELRNAFKTVAKEAGFRLRGTKALRHQNGVQQRMHFYRSRFAPYWLVQFAMRVDRPEDKGDEILNTWDIFAGVEALVERNEGWDARLVLRAAMDLKQEAPPEGRGPTLERRLREFLPWFDRYGSREAIERCAREPEEQRQMGGDVVRPFYDDFGIPLRS